MKKLFGLILCICFLFSGNCLAMQFFQPEEIGLTGNVQVNRVGIKVDGATYNTGSYYTGNKVLKDRNTEGYEKGVELMEDIESSGLIDKVREYAAVLGCVIMGGFSASFVTMNLAISYTAGETVVSLQSTLDSLVPRLLPLTYTLFLYYLITKKNANPTMLMIITIIVGAIGYLLGIFA